jgi:hypothetical protein
MKTIVILASVHEYQVPGNDRNRELEMRLTYLRSKFSADIVMEEWFEAQGGSFPQALGAKSGVDWANVGAPDEPQYRTYSCSGCIKHPSYDGTLKPYDPEHDLDAPWMDEYGPFENQENREIRMAANVQAQMANHKTGLLILGITHVHSVFGKLRCLGFKVFAFSWL